MSEIEGFVAQLVTDEQLLMNVGERDGVREGMTFEVLDPRTMNVKDPVTGENLGSLKRVKVRVVVTQVDERLSLARVRSSGTTLGAVSQLLAGSRQRGFLTSDKWPEGVEKGDPVVLAPPTSAETSTGAATS
jgi:hypothetical protein